MRWFGNNFHGSGNAGSGNALSFGTRTLLKVNRSEYGNRRYDNGENRRMIMEKEEKKHMLE